MSWLSWIHINGVQRDMTCCTSQSPSCRHSSDLRGSLKELNEASEVRGWSDLLRALPHGWWVVGPVASHCQSYDVFCPLRRLQNSEIERSMIWLSLRSRFIIIFPIKLQFIIQGQISGAIVALPWRRHGTVTAWSLSLLAVPRMYTEKLFWLSEIPYKHLELPYKQREKP